MSPLGVSLSATQNFWTLSVTPHPVTWAPFQYPIRRLIVRSREVSKPRDWCLELCDRFEIWQAPRQHCYRGACQLSEWCDNFNYQSRGFETSRDLTLRRLIGYWNGPQQCRKFPQAARRLLHQGGATLPIPSASGNTWEYNIIWRHRFIGM